MTLSTGGRDPDSHVLIVLVGALLLGAMTIRSAESPDILGIYDQMVISRAAAGLCAKPSAELLSRFEANFRIVSFRAMEEMKKRKSSMSTRDIRALMTERRQALTTKTRELVQSRGCQEKDMAMVVRRFELQSKWELAR